MIHTQKKNISDKITAIHTHNNLSEIASISCLFSFLATKFPSHAGDKVFY